MNFQNIFNRPSNRCLWMGYKCFFLDYLNFLKKFLLVWGGYLKIKIHLASFELIFENSNYWLKFQIYWVNTILDTKLYESRKKMSLKQTIGNFYSPCKQKIFWNLRRRFHPKIMSETIVSLIFSQPAGAATMGQQLLPQYFMDLWGFCGFLDILDLRLLT